MEILQRDLDHLNRMSTKIIIKLSTSDNIAWKQYAHDFDLTQSRIDEVRYMFLFFVNLLLALLLRWQFCVISQMNLQDLNGAL